MPHSVRNAGQSKREVLTVKFDNRPEKKEKLSLAKFSGWASGLAWFLMFSLVFTDQIFRLGEESEAVAFLCIGPFFIISFLGFIAGIITSLLARTNRTSFSEEDQNFAANGLKYGLMGIAFIFLAPLINRLLAPIGIELYDITSLFGR
jgi:hypothetical protein